MVYIKKGGRNVEFEYNFYATHAIHMRDTQIKKKRSRKRKSNSNMPSVKKNEGKYV